MPLTNIQQLRKADWERVEQEVVSKLRLLRGMVDKLPDDASSNRLAHDLILPALEHIGAFCTSIQVEESHCDN